MYLPPIPDDVASEARQYFSHTDDPLLCVIKNTKGAGKDRIAFDRNAIYFRQRPLFKEQKQITPYTELVNGEVTKGLFDKIYHNDKSLFVCSDLGIPIGHLVDLLNRIRTYSMEAMSRLQKDLPG
jgi:hypothetical protein